MRTLLGASAAAAAAAWSGAAGASPYSTKVTVEAVSDYSFYTGNHGADIPSVQEGNDFWNGIVGKGGWTAGSHYNDGSVYDTDFYDKDWTGGASDADASNFDVASTGVSLFVGHGTCNDLQTSPLSGYPQKCMTSSWCLSGGVCMSHPPSATEPYYCTQFSDRYAVVSSPWSKHGNLIDYTSGVMKLGESPQSGGFAGAGTNGGANLSVIVNSCSLRPPFWGEIAPVFAGAHLVAQIMVSAWGSDTTAAYNRGSYLAAYMLANPGAGVADAWFATMSAAGTTEGSSCPNFNGDYTYGGGHGIIGCGAHVVSSWDSSQWLADWHVNYESLGGGIWNDANDATSGAYGAIRWACNYDCNTYGLWR